VCHGKSKINETPHFPFKMLVRCIGLDIIRGIGQEDVVRHTLQADYHDFSSSLTDSFTFIGETTSIGPRKDFQPWTIIDILRLIIKENGYDESDYIRLD
jgi:hypothetical protein